jgi:hypothetical protein
MLRMLRMLRMPFAREVFVRAIVRDSAVNRDRTHIAHARAYRARSVLPIFNHSLHWRC